MRAEAGEMTSLRPNAFKVCLEAGPENAEQGLAAPGLILISQSITWKGLARPSPRAHWLPVTDSDLCTQKSWVCAGVRARMCVRA